MADLGDPSFLQALHGPNEGCSRGGYCTHKPGPHQKGLCKQGQPRPIPLICFGSFWFVFSFGAFDIRPAGTVQIFFSFLCHNRGPAKGVVSPVISLLGVLL